MSTKIDQYINWTLYICINSCPVPLKVYARNANDIVTDLWMSQIRCKNESIATSRAFQSEWNCYIPPVGKGREVAIRKCTYNITNLQKCSFIALVIIIGLRRNFEKAIRFTFQNIHLYAASKGSARWLIGKFCQSVNPKYLYWQMFPFKIYGN